MLKRSVITAAVAAALTCTTPFAHAENSEAQSLEELRNTVVNLLEALVQKGLMTREQAQALVTDAQAKASTAARAKSEQQAAEKDAVRVTHVPEIVKQEIGERVRAELRPEVTQEILAQAKAERWGVAGALPDWIQDVQLYGDVRVRAEDALYADDNATNFYVNFDTVNTAGGVGKAGTSALLNVTENRPRLVGRARLGVLADLGNAFKLDMRLASGNIRTPVSTNQTLGNYGGRWTVNLDKAAILWNPISPSINREFDFRFGRFSNPFVTTSELVWDNDVTFEGISLGYAMDLFGRKVNKMERGLFVTVGGFPLQEVELSSHDKWLFGGQLGIELPIANSSLRFTAAYYMYQNIAGIDNAVDSNLLDYTAPRFLQKGNTLFDIRNSPADPSANLFALAGDYRLVNANISWDLAAFGATHVVLAGDYVKNIGWKAEEVLARSKISAEARTQGYDVSLTVGRPSLSALGHWRGSIGYRYLERDAVLDAFTDSDFHLGGTDAKGYQLGFDLGLSKHVWIRARYLSANEIDDAPLGIDVLQLDLNGQF